MHKTIVLLLSIIILLAVSGTNTFSAANKAHSIGIVISLEGSSKAVGKDNKSRTLKIKSDIYLNDRISTGSNSKMQIMFNDDSVISQGENSELLIDEYLYNPKKTKDAKAKVGLIKGIFRVVTGKITDSNPDRYKLKTKMATIGVRGCELGLRLTRKREDIYMLWIPPTKSIWVEKIEKGDELSADGFLGSEGVLNILKGGVAVSIEKGSPLRERKITDFETRELINDSTPNSIQDRSSKRNANKIRGLSKDNELLASAAEKQNQDKTVSSELSRIEDGAYPPLPTSGPNEGPPDSLTPTKATPVLTAPGTSPFSTWWWEVLSDGSVDYGLASGSTDLDATDLSDIANVSPQYTLTGSGVSGAILNDGANQAVINGTLNINVNIGGPSDWDAEIRMSDATSHLNFDLSGSIDSSGALSGNIDEGAFSYSMQTDGGTVYNSSSIQNDSADGQLYGVGITGVAGEFHITHGSGTTADGGFGADL